MNLLHCMRIFATVATSGGYAAAARSLDSTTSVVSRSVAQLEAHLGVRLLNRTTRSVALTEAGEKYFLQCRQILSSIEEAEAEAAASSTLLTGRLRVHALSSFGQNLLLPSVLRYKSENPEVQLDLTLSSSLAEMIEERYDCSVVFAPELPDSSFVSVKLGSLGGVVCASPDYVRKHGMVNTPKELANHMCVQLANPVFPMEQWVFQGPDSIYSVDIDNLGFSVNMPEALVPAVADGLGIGLLPISTALPELKSGRLVRVLADYVPQPVNVYVLYQSRRFLETKVRAWVDRLRADIPETLAQYVEELERIQTVHDTL
ncbi:LysR family transcriptional regulator [Caballeronia arvi]|uniref:LysR family transcriptional regulator n=1 Tax=Caballeronia arvi TaxID=1777135 RepID=A0A158J322_9BURK|nr:LysR family transcriptional regulator [Caballeronia arvi]SAL63257.1 LysR family transcriptional regulator [Caballeronia arvi]